MSLRWHGSHFMSLCVFWNSYSIRKFWYLKKNMAVRYTDFLWRINRLISFMWQIKHLQATVYSIYLCLMFPSPDRLRWTHPCIGGGGLFRDEFLFPNVWLWSSLFDVHHWKNSTIFFFFYLTCILLIHQISGVLLYSKIKACKIIPRKISGIFNVNNMNVWWMSFLK